MGVFLKDVVKVGGMPSLLSVMALCLFSFSSHSQEESSDDADALVYYYQATPKYVRNFVAPANAYNKISYDNSLNPENGFKEIYFDGVALTDEQRERFTAYAQSGALGMINSTIGVTNLRPQINGSTAHADQYRQLETTLPVDSPVTINFETWSWGGDSDVAWLQVIYYDEGRNELGKYSTGEVNWPSNVVMQTQEHTAPAGTAEIRYWARCRRVYGNACSATIGDVEVKISPDLPPIGSEISYK